MSTASAPYREDVASFGRTSSLAGIMTHPTGANVRTPVLILGAGIIHKVGPSRVAVELARHLAAHGHPTLRFDLSGVGDSPRAGESTLQQAVLTDIRDAVTQLIEQSATEAGTVIMVGFCSGADNAFCAAVEDARVASLVLIDPSVHRTRGFVLRKFFSRVTSARAWWRLLNGERWRHRVAQRIRSAALPPDYYQLLVSSAEEADTRARALVDRGVRMLFVLSSGVSLYCNSPKQVAESLPTGFSRKHFTVLWRPDLDHILSTPKQRRDLSVAIEEWLGTLEATHSGNGAA